VTIWLYCLFGKEQMLMPYFLRHYAPQVDRLVMLSGGTDEETRRMVWECKNAEVHRSPFDEHNYDDRAFIEYAQERYKEARGNADWVLWVDADEFIYSVDPLRYSLEEYRRTGIRAIVCHGYQMIVDAPPTANEQLTTLVRRGVADKIYNKVCAFDPELDLRWSVGRHSCHIEGYNPVFTGMKLLHYRYFGPAWLEERNARNYARRSEADKAAGHGYHTAPDNAGRYSPAWYANAALQAEEVI
jgi:hypothetical protein